MRFTVVDVDLGMIVGGTVVSMVAGLLLLVFVLSVVLFVVLSCCKVSVCIAGGVIDVFLKIIIGMRPWLIIENC